MKFNEGVWQTQDEVELALTPLWRKIFQYMLCIMLFSVVVLFKFWLIGQIFQKSTVDTPSLTSYHRTVSLEEEPLPMSLPIKAIIPTGNSQSRAYVEFSTGTNDSYSTRLVEFTNSRNSGGILRNPNKWRISEKVPGLR